MVNANPLLGNWAGPSGGVPPFDQVRVADFKPALQAAMAEKLAEIDEIAGNTSDPSFENTIVALERSGQTFNRVSSIYGVWSSTHEHPGISGRGARHAAQACRVLRQDLSKCAVVRAHRGGLSARCRT